MRGGVWEYRVCLGGVFFPTTTFAVFLCQSGAVGVGVSMAFGGAFAPLFAVVR